MVNLHRCFIRPCFLSGQNFPNGPADRFFFWAQKSNCRHFSFFSGTIDGKKSVLKSSQFQGTFTKYQYVLQY
jgi:hypothetical protein